MLNRRVIRRGLLGAGVGFALIQLVPVDRSNPPVESETPAPPAVRAVLRRACYDCHSNETRWPWYGRIAPVSWLLERDVREGRREVDFSTWNRNDEKRRARKWKEIREQVEQGKMPPPIYTIVHGEARLSAEDRAVLGEWAARSAAEDRPPGQLAGN